MFSSALERPRIITFPRYYYQGIKEALKSCFVRKQVAQKLVEAASELPDDLMLMVWDAWRPESVQRALFERVVQDVRTKNSSLSEEEIHEEAAKYAADPDSLKLPPHATGGAVDVTLVMADLTPLNIGTAHDELSKKVKTDYFEKLEQGRELSSEEKEQCDNRRLLYNVMTKVGFTNYPEEWWHFDYGNQFWAAMKMK